ncbi:hypothetical protein SMC26_34470 [Actinomadura fulvescens]|uniref:Secreted protein n=1 Tax=Actinomadura fulvescens TaxID=46160 RepID=A0ABP6D4X8_9ACTN
MPPAPRRTVRRAAMLLAATALVTAAPVAAPAATAAPAHAKPRPKVYWHYVGSFPNFMACNGTGHWLVMLGNARDYRCLDSRDGSDLYAMSGPRL